MKLICPYCGREFSALKLHTTKKHHFNWEDVKKEFPDLKASSDERVEKYAEHMKRMNQDPVFNSKKVQKTEKKSQVARRNLELINNNPEKRKEVNKMASERMAKWNSSEEGRVKRSEVMRKYYDTHPGAGLRCNLHGKRILVATKDGGKLQLRSLLEMRVYQELRNNFDVKVDYETLKFKWIDSENKSHTYYPDLIIDDGNLIIEIKPLKKIDNIVMLKGQSVINEGYRFEIVTCKEDLYKIDYLVQRLEKA